MDHLSALLQADEEDESVDQGPWDSAQQEDVDEGGSWDEEGGAAEGAAAAGSAAVDLGLSREEVLERIEEFVAGYIKVQAVVWGLSDDRCMACMLLQH